ncbi:ATP-binding cassette domain-containing protein [Brochothrix thermosphacta]|uniref:ATP-binding cassette domain-containing protein n=1 Tax=Brochothrix thermosphacta TaxID=2756 RepID=UPI001C4F82E4
MIETQKLTKKFGNKVVLQPLSLIIEEGDFVVITGRSGSGKTTLLNILSLLEAPSSGILKHNGEMNLSRRATRQLKRDSYAYLFQNYGLIEEETVAANISIALAKKSKQQHSQIISSALAKVGLKNYEKQHIYELSGGQQQRVALARVIAKKTRWLFADEPTGNLDEANHELVFKLLKDLHTNGCTIVLVTHDSYMAKLATKTVHL